MGLYITGYIITFIILLICRPSPVKSQLIDYTDRMGMTAPFKCAKGNPISALLQAIIWPWPFVMLGLILISLPLIILYSIIFKK